MLMKKIIVIASRCRIGKEIRREKLAGAHAKVVTKAEALLDLDNFRYVVDPNIVIAGSKWEKALSGKNAVNITRLFDLRFFEENRIEIIHHRPFSVPHRLGIDLGVPGAEEARIYVERQLREREAEPPLMTLLREMNKNKK